MLGIQLCAAFYCPFSIPMQSSYMPDDLLAEISPEPCVDVVGHAVCGVGRGTVYISMVIFSNSPQSGSEGWRGP